MKIEEGSLSGEKVLAFLIACVDFALFAYLLKVVGVPL